MKYYKPDELKERYIRIVAERDRQYELVYLRFDEEMRELERKATISTLVDSQGRFPWEESYGQ